MSVLIIIIFASAVLKTVENVGVSYVKLSEPYGKKLDHESKNLNLPYRPESVSLFFNQPGLNVLLTLNTQTFSNLLLKLTTFASPTSPLVFLKEILH